jgi:hypothetical protein
MKINQVERLLSIYLAIGAAAITLVVAINTVTDPVNVPKLFLLGVVGCGVLVLSLANDLKSKFREIPIIYVVVSIFILISLLTFITTQSPLSQNFYGVYGRNNGLLTYALLSILLIAATQLRSSRSFHLVIISLFIAGFGNLTYSIWAVFFGDFIPWNNPYGNILGTFGNPNFIGSFFGMFTGAIAAQLFNQKLKTNLKLLLLASLPLIFFVTFKSNAIQGRVVGATSLALVLFFVIRDKWSNVLLALYSLFLLSLGIMSLLGALQKGPLSSVIYKTSVSLRGQYWAAGLNTGETHLWTGVGFDAFGDWYRRTRELKALVLPGPNVVVNASHNVPIDIFAFGGIPLFLSYLALLFLTAFYSFRFIKRTKKFDSTFVTLFTVWVGYQLQSIISINQIGLATWGWLLSGCLIAYSTKKPTEQNLMTKTGQKLGPNRRESSVISPGLIGGIGMLVGALISVPPLSADMRWRSAQISGDVRQIMSTLEPGYLNPQNTNRYLQIAIALESSNFNDEALKVTKQAIEFNPDSFETWRVAYFLKSADSELKSVSQSNMRRLDPLNPDVTSVE